MTSRLRIVYRQYRFEIAAVLALGVFVIAGLLISAWQFSTIHLPAGCDRYAAQNVGFGGPQPTAECINASQAWLNVDNGPLMHLTGSPWLLPFIFGVVLGAPLVAREVESGTAAISWALAGSRRRWLAGRMAAMLLLMVPLLIAAGFAADLLYNTRNQGASPWTSFFDYQGRGLPLLFWGLAAFAGTVALSSLTGRHAITLVLAAFICLTVRAQWDSVAAHTYLGPLSQTLATADQLRTGESSANWGVDLILGNNLYLHGEPWYGDINAWYNEHMVNTVEPDGSIVGNLNVAPEDMPASIPFGFYGAQYWSIVGIESAILFAGSLFCATVGLFWVGRRKPY